MPKAGCFAGLVCLMVLVGCWEEQTEKNLSVSPRLAAFHPAHAERNVECFLGAGGLLDDFEVSGYYLPAASLILKIDADLPEYLTTVANDSRSELYSHWKSGILAIQAQHDDYFAQFAGVKTSAGKPVILGFYAHRTLLELREETWSSMTYVPWCADGGERNFAFRYDPSEARFHEFHINGTQAGPFGSRESWLEKSANRHGPSAR